MKQTPRNILLAVLTGMLLAGCTKETKVERPRPEGYFERTKFILQSNNGYSLFTRCLKQTGMLDSLEGEGPYTVLAPEDNAFVASILALPYPLDPNTLRERMRYHILSGRHSLRQLPLGRNQEIPAADARKLWVSKWIDSVSLDTVITVNGCRVIQSDYATSNGYIDALEHVMELEDHTDIEDVLKNDQRLTFLSTALNRTGLFDYIRQHGDLTILAPDNNAFKASGTLTSMESVLEMDIDSLTRLIKHHVMPGRRFLSDLQTDIGPGNMGEFMMLDGTTIQAKGYAHFYELSFTSQGGNAFPDIYNGRFTYPADKAILHRLSGVLIP